MLKNTIFENAELIKTFTKSGNREYCNIYYDEPTKTVIDVWETDFGTPDNFQDVLKGVVEVVRTKRAKKWLADLRSMKGGFQNSTKFLEDFVMKEVERFGLKYEAVLLPGDVFASLSAKGSVKSLKEKVKVEVVPFDSMEKAVEWLESKKV